ncbi:MAG: hypothetical protein M3O91_08480 [Chloroflexota bacterium]|nr:hypothetical protein [Chloroflexota bacterium]
MRHDTGGFGETALAAGLVALCCGGPVLLDVLAATGIGAWLLAPSGLALAGNTLLVAAILGALWPLRRGWRLARAENKECCAPAEPAHSQATR